jgi:cytochrome c-type biogenesis protein CcmH/NrfG
MAKPKKPVVRNAAAQKAQRLHTLKRKIAKLEKQLHNNPGDISADIALSQARYNLSINLY